ncbi:MAG: hypothetical protein OXE76_12805, partial [Alphaproteobacteria bacterium]|nr:hypothetical protein [Alphaproteobacteria bacterium]
MQGRAAMLGRYTSGQLATHGAITRPREGPKASSGVPQTAHSMLFGADFAMAHAAKPGGQVAAPECAANPLVTVSEDHAGKLAGGASCLNEYLPFIERESVVKIALTPLRSGPDRTRFRMGSS